MKLTGDELAITALAMTQAVVLFTTFCPDLDEVYSDSSPEKRHATRYGEGMAAAIAILFGVVLSVIDESLKPLLFSLLLAVVLMLAYEHAMRQNPVSE